MEKPNLPVSRRPHLLVRYGAAIVLVGLALFLTLPLREHFMNLMVSPLFFCAVILTAWYGGFGPGFFAGLLSVVAIEYYLKSATADFEVSVGEVSRSAEFLFATFLISWICG